jgi:hydrogenase maturation factor HypF (carbamoyltransferase family)
MSFRLAGVDDNTISLGYIESYTHFISNIVDEVNAQTKLDGISLCGDMFANETVSRFVHKSITKNFKIYYNKDFVVQVI